MSRYQILDELGQGGMGVVYRALHVSLKREVALKLLVTESAKNDRFIKRFHREVKVLAGLSHPNIVRIYDSGEMDGRPYYTMEVVDGVDLARLVEEQSPLPVGRVLSLVRQAVDALAYIHSNNLLHRDIKLRNLMVDRSDQLKLMDFGLAKPAEEMGVTREGTILGTPLYMAPEVLQGLGAIAASDLYSLAICVHELLLGRSWMHCDSLKEVAARVVNGAAPTLEGVRDDVPQWLVNLQARTLAKSPEARPTAAEYREEVRRWSGSVDGLASTMASSSGPVVDRSGPPKVPAAALVAASLPAPPVGQAAPPKLPRRRRSLVSRAGLGLTAGFLAGVVCTGALLMLNRSPSRLWQSPGGPSPTSHRSLVASAIATAQTPPADPGQPASPIAGQRQTVEQPGRSERRARLANPRLLSNRSLAVQVEGEVPRGAFARLVSSSRSGARTEAIEIDGEVVFRDLAPTSAIRVDLLGPAGEVLSEFVSLTTPAVEAVQDLLCLPFESSVLVDFQYPFEGEYRVEVGPWGQRAPSQSVARDKGGRFFHKLVGGLKPNADYFVRVVAPSGWPRLSEYRFRTQPQAYAKEVAAQIATFERDFPTAQLLSGLLLGTTDPRWVPVIRRHLPTVPADRLESLAQFARVARELRDPELSEALLPFVDRVSDGLRVDLIAAATAAHHPRASELGQAHLDRAADHGNLEACVKAMAVDGGREACDRIAARVEPSPDRRTGPHPPIVKSSASSQPVQTTGAVKVWDEARGAAVLGMAMVRCDPERAGEHFRRWLARPEPNKATLIGALRGLTPPASEHEARSAARLMARSRPEHQRVMVAEGLASTGTPSARKVLLEAFLEDPAQPNLLWSVARLPTPGAAAALATLLTSSTRTEVRARAACALGLIQARGQVADLVRALADPQPRVASAAAWALAWVGDSRATEPLLAMAGSARDAQGAAAWALGNLEVRSAVGRLRWQLAELHAAGPPSQTRQAAIVWALGRLARVGDPTAMDALPEIEMLARSVRSPPLVREVATVVTRDLLGRGNVEAHPLLLRGRSPADPAPPIRPFRDVQIHAVLPLAAYHRTGILLDAGESVDVSCRGLWGFASVDGALRPVEQTLSQEGVGRTDVRLVACIGAERLKLERTPQRILAPRAGELVLSPYHGRTLLTEDLPDDDLSGMALVIVER
ncbi:MAG: protein kinase [Candidatus Riflebacteria bacterium]|nr:protein kinase [Candidatus Riflebacteria bacterium]